MNSRRTKIAPSQRELANAIRALSMDAVEQAKSGHPGMPMGMADVATVLFTQFLKFQPHTPDWPDRDRFILSAGHASMLLYSLLYLTGYKDITIKEIKKFRQLGGKCAGHPELGHAKGIETTTGPLGQGIGNAVGMAIAEQILSKRFGKKIVDHNTYVFASDGDLMEGISHEVCSLAGHLQLKKLIVFFDNNKITIDGPTSLTTSDNTLVRFKSYNWEVITINGHNFSQITSAIRKAKKSKKPVLINCKTVIGYGSPNKQGTASTHGAPLGEEEVKSAKNVLDWQYKKFEIPKAILSQWRFAGNRSVKHYKKWNRNLKKENSENRIEFNRVINGALPKKLNKVFQDYRRELIRSAPSVATRKASEMTLSKIQNALPELVGGSADLSGSNNTKTKDVKVIQLNNFSGNYIHYGIREHGMASIMNGMALHKGLIPFGGTFLIFSDYCRPSIRLSALMKQRIIYVMSHDSIGLGEDGPTHQPIEQLMSLRAIPNLKTFRPADTVETAECWQLALENNTGPSIIALTRQKVPHLRTNSVNKNLSSLGAYELIKPKRKPMVTIIASGSEVHLAIEVMGILKNKKILAKVVSMPCWELFDKQDQQYQNKILDNDTLKVSIEAGSTIGWYKYIGNDGLSIGINEFGVSAPYDKAYEFFNFDSQRISSRIMTQLKKNNKI